jgi:hypothetical protein
VHFRYRPQTFWSGAAISATALVIALAIPMISLRGRKRDPDCLERSANG